MGSVNVNLDSPTKRSIKNIDDKKRCQTTRRINYGRIGHNVEWKKRRLGQKVEEEIVDYGEYINLDYNYTVTQFIVHR
jgi:hypothetical protein